MSQALDSATSAAARVQFAPVEGAAQLFTHDFCAFLVGLCDRLTPRAHALRTRRAEALHRALHEHAPPAHPPVSGINTGD